MPTEKLRDLSKQADKVEVLVVGTSRMLHGFDPAIFAAETQSAGHGLSAYNLSLQRLLLWEQERIIADALAIPGLKPRLILLEPAVGLGIAPENFTHARTLEYETPAAWVTAVRVIQSSDRPWWHRAWNITSHTVVLALHAVNYGAGNALAFPPLTDDSKSPGWATDRGFIPLAPRTLSAADEAQLALWCDQHRRDYEHAPVDREPLPAAMRDHFIALRTRLEATGARVVFVQPPQLGFTTDELRRLSRRFEPSVGPIAPVLSFLDPARHPHLFAPRLWSDYNHLNAEGAAAFTRDLAQALRPDLAELTR